MIDALLAFLVLLALAACRVPLAFAMALVGFGALALTQSLPAAISSTVQTVMQTGGLYTLSVIPLFTLMGNLVTRSGLSKELYTAAYSFVGHRPGGLATSTIVACAGFGAICGSSLATAATMARVALPEMEARRYKPGLATASIAAGGTLGILIPPSVIMVLYGLMTDTSIGALFAAGVLPGIVATLFYVGAVRWTTWRDPAAGPRGERVSLRDRLVALREVWRVLALFGVVLGGIYGGVFTPTEAAGIGAAGAFLIALARRELRLYDYVEVLVDSARTSAMIFAVLLGALIFANYVNFTSMSSDLVALIEAYRVHPLAVIFMMIAIYVLLGCLLESISMIVLTVPVFYPIVQGLGFDLVWFGILVVVVTEISLITPPVGMNVFVLRAFTPHVPTGVIFRGLVPFVVVDFVRIAILALVPAISLALPTWLKLIR
ncbi:TRAP transporter large permease [Rhodoplanes serenus]|uniref:TRAP transporter large permease n=1 Tax=Rhodoplanes serenus TaxID=200615 RepID=UPI000DAB91DE|nr:TRAP transporter large permease [Rhodoplanes serenus]RAI37219.1 C4-dicarboxylate ABC transporter permease [Rhodoplanes serenus]